MFKTMLMFKRKAGMTLNDFIDHYETKHVPLVVKYQKNMTRYLRHYVRAAPYPLDGKVTESEYDVFAEIWFDDFEAYQAGMALIAAEGASHALAEDERQFIDPGKSCFAIIEEHESPLPGRTHDPETDVRRLVLLKRKPGTTVDQFIDYYENVHQKLGIKYSGEGMSRYRRLFLRPEGYPIGGAIAEPAYDVVTEVSLSVGGGESGAASAMSDPEINRIIEADESNFIDRTTRNFATVKTRETVL